MRGLQPNSSFGVWLEQERNRPQATEGHCQGLAGHRPSWASGEESGGLCGGSQAPEGRREVREPGRTAPTSLCLKGEGQARLANVGCSCQNHKSPISSARAVSLGCACPQQEPFCPGGCRPAGLSALLLPGPSLLPLLSWAETTNGPFHPGDKIVLLPKSPLASHCLWKCLNNEAPKELWFYEPEIPQAGLVAALQGDLGPLRPAPDSRPRSVRVAIQVWAPQSFFIFNVYIDWFLFLLILSLFFFLPR